MDLRKIKELIALADDAGLAELDVREGEGAGQKRIRIVRMAVPAQGAAAPAAPAAIPGAVTPVQSGDVFPAPLAGTFYRAAAPGEAPFVEVGQGVAVGETLCIVESMKMMNKVASDRAGTVAEVLADNGQPVETGTPLFRIV